MSLPENPSGEAIRLLWDTPPRTWTLEEDDLHVWAVGLEKLEPLVAAAQAVLSPDEKQRAAQYRFDDQRCCWMASRVFLRRMLSLYLQCDPASIRFGYGPHGKPFLTDHTLPSFNLSHSGKLVVLAVSNRDAVGIDVQQVARVSDIPGIARRFFTPEEQAQLEPLRTWEREDLFHKIWARKEAILKYTGRGIAGIEAANQKPFEGFLADWIPAPGFFGAVAAPQPPRAIRFWRWTPALTD